MTNNGWKKVGQGETVDFKKTKEIQGKYLGVDTNVPPNDSNLYHLDVGDKELSVWGSTVLDNQMQRVQPGEEVRIVYLGEEINPKTKRTFKNFEVYHREAVTDTEEATIDEEAEEVPF